jgi:choice-of-anchor B domain-containing protein
MKKFTPFLMSFICAITFAQTPCENGFADGFPCDKYDLQARLTLNEMNAGFSNDSWGWTDPNDGKEYALVGLDNGTAFVDISDPVNIVYLGKLPAHSSSSIWRDLKVYNNYVFVVSEANGHGMQVFDLTRLRNVISPPETFTEDAWFGEFGDAHNIVINEDSGYAYVVGAGPFNGGPIFIDISDPVNPVAAGGYSAAGYTHDAQVVNYTGPDNDYTGREIMIASNADEIVIVDVTDKNNPQSISNFTYANTGYTHQGWFTEDQRYFLAGDEGDESNFGFNTRTLVVDMEDLDNPQLSFEFFGETDAIDHNGYVVGDTFYLANYSAGIRMFDISDIENGNMTPAGYFDTYPNNNNTNFSGVWNVYPFFASGNIMITGGGGFTLVKGSEPPLAVNDEFASGLALYPNPASDAFVVSSQKTPITQIEVYNILGQRLFDFNFSGSLSETVNISSLNSGLYIVKVNNNTSKRLIVD